VGDVVSTTPAVGRLERLSVVASTNDVVRRWLADGTPEVCVAVADEQSAGRGRLGRSWTAPAGAALLLSAGFRPTWLRPDRAWRIGATVSLAMADAAEDAAGLPVGAVRLKWPNDLVVETHGPNALLVGVASAAEAAARLGAPVELLKLAGVLGESQGLGTDDPRVVVGIGVNADWAAADFPPDLAPTMTSLREAAAGRPIDREALLEAFLDGLEARLAALRAGFFDVGTWTERQALTGLEVMIDGGGPAGGAGDPVRVLGVDAATGALVVGDPDGAGDGRSIHAGEVVRVRLARDGV
jgi:BirA family transcriptional regulator, biotin operon repressor / biotin---[acetyl-CoA-carboxylase] ligase